MRAPLGIACIAALTLLGTPGPADAEESTFSLFLAGDMIVMRPFAQVDDAQFLQLVERIRKADAAIVNLETLFHRFEGYAQAESGGTYMASSPKIADDLDWAGIDVVSTANNHTFDYGTTGVVENLKNLAKAGILAAGSGEDLQRARAPTYYRHPRGTVAVISTTATFFKSGRASRTIPGMRGRPGLNPLKGAEDRQANLAAIAGASRDADLTVVAIHDHKHGSKLRQFAHDAIDAGADVIVAHGPHEIRGIELYKDRPIFYSLGNFFYEQYHVERLPPEAYDRTELGDGATAQEVMTPKMTAEAKKREPWEGLGAVVTFKGRTLSRIELIPLDLGSGAALADRGRPALASPALGRDIIAVAKARSETYGTRVNYIAEDNIGLIDDFTVLKTHRRKGCSRLRVAVRSATTAVVAASVSPMLVPWAQGLPAVLARRCN